MFTLWLLHNSLLTLALEAPRGALLGDRIISASPDCDPGGRELSLPSICDEAEA